MNLHWKIFCGHIGPMKRCTFLLVLFFSSAVSSSVFAAADCPKYPKAEWMMEADLKKSLEADGYKIKKFKTNGDCYEIYGWDKAGKKVEIYFDMKTGKPLKSEVH